MSSRHLTYYRNHKIAPVTYEMGEIHKFLGTRERLYRRLGLPNLIFQGRRVLEVAAGTGQNSMHIARNRPQSLLLIEPNEYAKVKIDEYYSSFALGHTQPTVLCERFEDYESKGEGFDIVVCENWLGRSESDCLLRKRCLSYVNPGGFFITTVITPIGILPNLIRKVFALSLTKNVTEYADRLRILQLAFDPHLSTLSSTNRSSKQWIQDNLMNPAYCGIVYTLPELIDDLHEQGTLYSTYPNFSLDMRWFKSETSEVESNQLILDYYYRNLLQWIDFRSGPCVSGPPFNREIENSIIEIFELIYLFDTGESGISEVQLLDIKIRLSVILSKIMGRLTGETRHALEEALSIMEKDAIVVGDVSAMQRFSHLFGRETVYAAVERRDWKG